jgi:hypothetical protein
MARYKTYKIENTPSEKFPQMVTISKKVKGNLFEKKFISEQKAKAWIELGAAHKLINNGAKKVKNELGSIGILTETPAW